MSEKKEVEQKIKKAYQHLCDLQTQIAGIGPIKKGTLSTRMMKCGKKNCRCHQDPKYRHGPYHWWTTKVKGHSKAVMVHEQMFETYRSFIENYRVLKSIIGKMEESSDTILEEETRLFKMKQDEK